VPERIVVTNPIISQMFDKFADGFFSARLSTGFEVKVENLDFGAETIEAIYDETVVAPSVVERTLGTPSGATAAVVINCFLDPGLHAAREVARIPAIRPGESSMLVALLFKDTFSILHDAARSYRQYASPLKVRELGIESAPRGEPVYVWLIFRATRPELLKN
jgi:Asp/Glu/hydantoin racemase